MKKEFNVKAQMTHVALHVKDTRESAEFYKKWAGMEEVHSHGDDVDGKNVIWMASPGQEDDFVIVLVPGANDNRQGEGMRHIGLSVGSEQDVKDIAEQAKQDGILHWDYMTMKWPVGTLCSVRDPDGYIVEFSYGQPLGQDFKNSQKKASQKGPNL